MEILLSNFDKKCLLLKHEGYVINGECDSGMILESTNSSPLSAKVKIGRVCGKCGYCEPKGNCNPLAEDPQQTEVIVKIN